MSHEDEDHAEKAEELVKAAQRLTLPLPLLRPLPLPLSRPLSLALARSLS